MACTSITRTTLSPSTKRSLFIARSFHTSNPPKKRSRCIRPGKQTEAFADGLRKSGVVLEEAHDGIPFILHDIRKAIRPKKPDNESTSLDRNRLGERLKSFQVRHNESTFTHSILPELLPTFGNILDEAQHSRRHDHVVLDGPWLKQEALDPMLDPQLSMPKTDGLYGFRDSFLDEYPEAKRELGPEISPLGRRLGLYFPFYSLEAKCCHGERDVAVLQNAHATALMLRSLWRLGCRARLQDDSTSYAGVERIAVLSSVLTPFDCNLVCHWVKPSGFRLEYCWRQIRRWNFPKEFENASRGLVSAIDWTRQNLEGNITQDMGRLEKQLGPSWVMIPSAGC